MLLVSFDFLMLSVLGNKSACNHMIIGTFWFDFRVEHDP
jgi:hypothetical protein